MANSTLKTKAFVHQLFTYPTTFVTCENIVKFHVVYNILGCSNMYKIIAVGKLEPLYRSYM